MKEETLAFRSVFLLPSHCSTSPSVYALDRLRVAAAGCHVSLISVLQGCAAVDTLHNQLLTIARDDCPCWVSIWTLDVKFSVIC